MAKVRVTKTVESMSGPGGGTLSSTTVATPMKTSGGPGDKILTDEQVEQWSKFAEKNRNLNFDQKWDAFSRSNPKFTATKQNVYDALLKYRKKLTEDENARIERGYSSAPRSGPLGNTSALFNTDDIFLPIIKNGKVVSRDTEDMTPSSLYKQEPSPEQEYIRSRLLKPSQIPEFSRIQPNSGVLDKPSGIVRYLRDDGTEFAVNLRDVENLPGYSERLQQDYSEVLRSLKQTPEPQKLRIQKK